MINKDRLSERIKKNEGFSNKIYLDTLNNPTIGYGHLIKKGEKFVINKKYKKSFLSELFEKDLAVSIEEFNKIFNNQEFPKIINEVIIEMLFQMGKKNFLTFKKFIKLIKKNNFKEASEEMIKSKWHEQTPKRARLLASLVEKKNE